MKLIFLHGLGQEKLILHRRAGAWRISQLRQESLGVRGHHCRNDRRRSAAAKGAYGGLYFTLVG